MVRQSPQALPLLNDGESPKLIALTTTHGLHVLKVTHYDSFDAESTPRWCTACSEAWTVEYVCRVCQKELLQPIVQHAPETTPAPSCCGHTKNMAYQGVHRESITGKE